MLAVSDPSARQRRLQRVLPQIEARLATAAGDSSLLMELLPIKMRVLVEQGDLDGVRVTISGLYALYQAEFGDAAYDHWLDERVDRMRDPGNFRLAIVLLEEALTHAVEPSAGQGALLLGDIWLQGGEASGSYQKAIEQYARVAQKYEAQAKDLADMARFRQAKAHWWSGETEEAKAIFEELGRSGDRAVEELAEHYLSLPDIKNPPSQLSSP